MADITKILFITNSDKEGNSLTMYIDEVDLRVEIRASGPIVDESCDIFVEYRGNEKYAEPATLIGKDKDFDILFQAFIANIGVHDTPYDYEDSRDAGKTWVLWERVAQALGYENKPKEFVVY